MPDGMGLGMSGQTPWGRSFAGMQNSMTFPGMGFQWPSMRSATPPRMPPNPATQAQPGPVKADMGGIQQALGNLQGQQAGKMAADEEKARQELNLRALLGGFPGLKGSLPGLDGGKQGLWAGMKTAFVLENSDGEKTAAENSDQATRDRAALSAAWPWEGAAPCGKTERPAEKTAQVVGAYLEKTAAPAWVKMIQKGALSPQSIERVAGSLPAGKFRFLGNLGRGQFNVADKVVGNVGGHAGEMVRKLPAHAYTNPGLAYEGLKPFVDRINRLIPTQTGKPLIAPYLETGSQGAFQRLGTEDIGRMPMAAKHYLSDLHAGNIGPGGQIIDFAAKDHGLGWAPKAARRVSHLGADPTRTQIPGGVDTATTIAQDNPLNQRINNAIRHFYHAPADVRQNFPGVTNIAPPTTATSIPSNLPETVPYKPSPATLGSSPIQRIGLGLLGTAGGLATALNKHGDDGMDAIARYLQKRAAQDNSAPQRSATGESEGLSYQHKEDDYAQGQAAWAATSKYFKGGGKLHSQPNPFRGKHRGKAKRAMDTLSGVNTQGTVAKPGKPAKPAKALRTRPPRVKRANLAAVSGVKDSAKTSDPILLRQAIIAELDASNLYDQMGDSTGNNRLRSLFGDVSREEKVHVGEFTRLLNAADPENPGALAEGQAEVKQSGDNAFWCAKCKCPRRKCGCTHEKAAMNLNPTLFAPGKTPILGAIRRLLKSVQPSRVAGKSAAVGSLSDRRKAQMMLGLNPKDARAMFNESVYPKPQALSPEQITAAINEQGGPMQFPAFGNGGRIPRFPTAEKLAYTGPTQLSLQGQMPSPAGNAVIARLLAARRQQRKGMDADVTMLDKNAAASAPMMPARLISRLVPLNARREDTDMQPSEMQSIEHGQGQLIPEPFQTDATPIPELMASPGKQGLLAGVAGGLVGGGLGYGAGKLAERLGGTGEHSGLIGGLLGGVGGAALAGLSRFKGQRRRNEHLEEIMRRLPPGATKHDYVNTEMLWEALMNRFGGEKISADKHAGALSWLGNAAGSVADFGANAYHGVSDAMSNLGEAVGTGMANAGTWASNVGKAATGGQTQPYQQPQYRATPNADYAKRWGAAGQNADNAIGRGAGAVADTVAGGVNRVADAVHNAGEAVGTGVANAGTWASNIGSTVAGGQSQPYQQPQYRTTPSTNYAQQWGGAAPTGGAMYAANSPAVRKSFKPEPQYATQGPGMNLAPRPGTPRGMTGTGMHPGVASLGSRVGSAAPKAMGKLGADVGPFASAFLQRCVERGLTVDQIQEGIDQVGLQFGKEASDELQAGLEKLAAPIPWGQLAGKATNFLGKALTRTRGAVAPAAQTINRAIGGQGGKMLGGAMTGYTAAHDPSNTESSMLNPMSWGGREWAGALGGAAFGRAMPHMGNTAQAAGRRAFGGMMAGNTLGMATDLAGFEGVGDQLGRAGAIGGFASPWIKGLKPGQMAPKVQQAGQTFNQVFQKPWEKATGLNPKSVWQGMTNKAAPMAERVGMGLGPGMVTAGLGGAVASTGKAMYDNHIQGLKQQFGDEAVSRVSQAAPQIFQQITGFSPEQAKSMASSAQGLSQLMNIGDPIFKMLGMDPTQMSGIQKIMLLLGGGAMLGGMLGGSGGMTGMGGLAMLGGLAMGGFPGLGGGQAPAGPSLPAGNAGMTSDAATGTMRPTPYLNTTQPQPRNELAVQRAAARGNPQMAENDAVNQAMLS